VLGEPARGRDPLRNVSAVHAPAFPRCEPARPRSIAWP
jgi:hypothetical protein